MSLRNFKLSEFRKNISEHYEKNPVLVTAIAAFLVILVLAIIALSAINGLSLSTESPEQKSYMPTMLAVQNTPVALSTPIILPTPSNEWVVSERLPNVTQNGITYAVAVFKNVSDGSLVTAQCQQPKLKEPEIGHLYLLQISEDGEWLFFPVEGEGTFQMFKKQ